MVYLYYEEFVISFKKKRKKKNCLKIIFYCNINLFDLKLVLKESFVLFKSERFI